MEKDFEKRSRQFLLENAYELYKSGYLDGARAALQLCEKEALLNLESVKILLDVLEKQIGDECEKS